ncbi:glutamine cyclotransferase [Trinickia dabaoshanensis]|uniref:Glutamine cyclotransferase n=1 Tax=Trinickia dabaoshanensis TaxID=564714 RepID=A0A2N7VD27_9BURK|nr:glutamine cyclotransferase [Trinickia dabaoshanensis]PMS15063.1 glutamine cyclotransferase [Trinickia dabaoshanensis]
MKRSDAQIEQEFGPLPGVDNVAGVTYDGENVWFAAGDKLCALDPASGELRRTLDVPASAGTAFDGKHLFQIDGDVIRKIEAASGQVLATIATPPGGGYSGLAWAEGLLWIARYGERKIYQMDPDTGAVLRTIESNRFVTGVTWVDDELWHGTWEDERSEIRHVDPQSGEVIEALAMPEGMIVAGLESDGGDRFFCGGGTSGKVRTVRRPARLSKSSS